MSFKKYIGAILLLFISFNLKAQVSDTIFVNETDATTIKFPAEIQKVTYKSLKTQYETDLLTKEININAKIENSAPDVLTIKEGKKEPYNEHKFIIAYKKELDLSTYDFTNADKLSRHDRDFAANKPKSTPKVPEQQTTTTKQEEKKNIPDVAITNGDKDYYSLLDKADADIKNGDLDEAKKKFEQARKIKPDSQYPVTQLAYIKQKMDESAKQKQDKISEQYGQLISEGNQLITQKNYSKAKEKFEQAKTIKPDDLGYTTNQLAKIDKLIHDEQLQKDQQDKFSKYQSLMSQGDKAYNQNSFDDAKEFYSQALKYKEGDLQASNKIAAINNKQSLLKDQADLEKKYNSAYGQAEILYNAGDLENAKKYYETANSFIKKAEITDRIREINKRMNATALQALTEKEKSEKETKDKEKYQTVIQKADNEFKTEKYADAKKSYALAATLKPEESYPNDMLARIESKLTDIKSQEKLQKEKEDAAKQSNVLYNTAIARGKNFYQKSDLANALAAYTDAANLKPGENEPRNQLALINKKLDSIKSSNAINERYALKISIADSLLFKVAEKVQTADAFKAALNAYQEASQIKSSDYLVNHQIKYINSEIARLDKVTAKSNEKKEEKNLNDVWDSTYRALRHQGLVAHREKRYDDALKAFNQYLKMGKDKNLPEDNDIKDMADKLQFVVSNNKTNSSTPAPDLINKPQSNNSNNSDANKIESVNAIIVTNMPGIQGADQNTESMKRAAQYEKKQISKVYTRQAKPIPYEESALHKKYPDIDFTTLPPGMRMNPATNPEENNAECLKLLEQKPDIYQFVSNSNINLICNGISFKGTEAYMKFLIQNNNNTDFLTGTLKLSWDQQAGNSINIIPNYIYPVNLPIISGGNDIYIILVTRAYNISNDETLTFEMNDRFKRIKLNLSVPGSVYNKEKNK